jgi:hypothetical protein
MESTSLVNRLGSRRAHPKRVSPWSRTLLAERPRTHDRHLPGWSTALPSVRLNAIDDQEGGTRYQPLVRLSQSGAMVRDCPCALACRLLRSTSRLGRAGREKEAAHGSDAEPPRRSSVTTCRRWTPSTRRTGRAHRDEIHRQPRSLPAGRGTSRWLQRPQRRACSALRPHKVGRRGTAAAGGQGSDRAIPAGGVQVRPMPSSA